MTVLARTVDVWGGLLSSPTSVAINKQTLSYIGTGNLSSRGSLISDTVLNSLVTAFVTDAGSTANLYTIGANTIPALGNSYDGITTLSANRLGYINVLAKQAETEFSANTASFVSTFEAYRSWKLSTNRLLVAATNGADFLTGTYSNREDFSTADVTNVNLDTANWGQDLIDLGIGIDIQKINTFGLPSNLLQTITDRRLATTKLRLLIASNFTETQINNLQQSAYTPTTIEQQTLYTIFSSINDRDLADLLVSMQIRTRNLTSLADLLDPAKIFPRSYRTLTVPFYQPENTNGSKMFDFIYSPNSNSVNPRISAQNPNVGNYLVGILPDDLAVACGAFALSMGQITNIQQVAQDRFGIAVANLMTQSDNNLIGIGSATNPQSSAQIISLFPGGSGEKNTFLMCDFFGVASGIRYNPLYSQIQALIDQLTTNRLTQAYAALAAGVTTVKITEANNAIAEILSLNPGAAGQLNTLWQRLNTQLQQEIIARATAATDIGTVELATRAEILNFGESIGTTYYRESLPCDTAAVLKALSDTTTFTGQAISSLLTDAHNHDLLSWANIPTYNRIETEIEQPGVPIPQGVLPDLYPGQIVVTPPQPNPELLLDNVATDLQSGQFTPDTAIQAVIDCNCDCWTN